VRATKAKDHCNPQRRGLNDVAQNQVAGQPDPEHQRKDDKRRSSFPLRLAPSLQEEARKSEGILSAGSSCKKIA